MTLITPKFPTEEQIAVWRERLAEHYPDWEYTPPHIIREGLIADHLNVSSDFKLNNKIDEYPVFRVEEWAVRLHTNTLADDEYGEHAKRRATEELAKYAAVPANVDQLYVKEKWLDYWRREHRYAEDDSVRFGTEQDVADFEEFEPCLNPYGVIDKPEQLLELYDFDADPRRFFISVTPMLKQHQSEDGGWRWHKWGPYLGSQRPTMEYLYDEPVIEEVWVYHIYQLTEG